MHYCRPQFEREDTTGTLARTAVGLLIVVLIIAAAYVSLKCNALRHENAISKSIIEDLNYSVLTAKSELDDCESVVDILRGKLAECEHCRRELEQRLETVIIEPRPDVDPPAPIEPPKEAPIPEPRIIAPLPEPGPPSVQKCPCGCGKDLDKCDCCKKVKVRRKGKP
jgi:hypothetical protein